MAANYYFSQMNKQQQAAYHAMLQGVSSLEPAFYVPMLEEREFFDTYFLMRLDHPEIFYSEGVRYRYYSNSSNVEAETDYLFEKKKIKAHQQAMSARVEKLARCAERLSEEEKLLYIHDFICGNVRYDKLKKQYSHEIIGPLGQGVGVCEGIAKSVKILCDALDIWCCIAISEAAPEKGIKYRHAWNIVKVGGQYYHMDVTFDNSLGKGSEKRYDYFMLSDSQIFKDHEPVIWKVPACCDGSSFYYKKKKLSFTRMEEVASRAAQAAKKGKTLTFHWRGGGLNRQLLQEMLSIIEEGAQARGKHAKVSANISQAVIRAVFEDGVPQQQLVVEEADEGNQE